MEETKMLLWRSYEAYKKRECPPVDCVTLPSFHTARKREMAKQLGFYIFNLVTGANVSEKSSKEERDQATEFYRQTRKRIFRAYHQYPRSTRTRQAVCRPKTEYHLARTDKKMYDKLKTATTISYPVSHPLPMPVDVAPRAELEQFFQRLQKNDPFQAHFQDSIGSYEKFVRGALYTDGRLDLCKQVVGHTHIGALMTAMAQNEHVKYFLLGNNVIGSDGARAIANFIRSPLRKCSISVWYLAGNLLDGDSVGLLVDAILSNLHRDTVHELWLKRNHLGVVGARHIARYLRANPPLRVLDLENTAIYDEGAIAIFEALQHNTNLEVLYLDANALTPACCSAIATYFDRPNVSLKRLFISINRLGDEGIRILFSRPNSILQLQTLNVSSNRIELDGLRLLLEQAEKMPSLQALDIGHYKSTADMGELPNSFGDEGARMIASFIRRNNTLLSLSIHNTHITDLSPIEEALAENKTLIHGTLEQGPLFSPMAMKRFAENFALQNGGTYDERAHKLKSRFVRHGETIWVIDSIYRNRM